MVCSSYATLARRLGKDALATILKTGEVDELHLPASLWNVTRESLSECFLGDAAIRLVRLAAHFSADGFPLYILRRLWETDVFPKFKDEEMDAGEAFERVLDMCRAYNIFQETSPVRIHRLDRAAILAELGDSSTEIEEAIGCSLADYPGASPELWLFLADFPNIICWVPESVANGKFYVSILSANPLFADRCPWEKLDGKDWAKLLKEQPQFADRCPWEKLDGGNWADLLAHQPQFADKCPWEKLCGMCWARLLADQPQFADRCPWEKLDNVDWVILLGCQPQFADRCPWEKLDGEDWAWLLRLQPQFADRCPWEKLSEADWERLLRWRPRFADKCPYEKLKGKN